MKRKKLGDVIFEDMQNRIYAGEFRPNNKLPNERELADHYQVSRVPVREAIRKLTDTGVINTTPGVGSFITANQLPGKVLSKDETMTNQAENMMLIETIHLRQLIEAEAARLAAVNKTSAGIANLEIALFNTITEIRKLKADEPNTFFEADNCFHRSIIIESQNKLLLQCYDAMTAIIMKHQLVSLSHTSPRDEVIPYHTMIFESIIDGNCENAAQAMFKHLSRVEILLLSNGSGNTDLSR